MSDAESSGNPTDADHWLDARGLLCPLPVIRTQDAIRTIAPGEALEVWTSDPGAAYDIPAWCRVHGHTLLSEQEVDDGHRFRIRVVASD